MKAIATEAAVALHIPDPEALKRFEQIELVKMFWASPDASWHTPETVAAVAGLSLQTLKNWRCEGSGPTYGKSGKLVYYTKADVLAWFKTFQPSRLPA